MSRQGFDGTSPMYFSTREIANGISSSELTAEEREHLQAELAQIDDEINTLRQVLLTKEKHAGEIRRQLGLSPLSNIKQNISKGWQEVQTSSPYLTASATLDDITHSNIYVRSKENLSYAGQVTASALSSVGVALTRRLAEMRALPLPSPPRHTMSVPTMRHSSTFKSIEEVVGSVKDKVTGTMTSNGDTTGFESRSRRTS